MPAGDADTVAYCAQFLGSCAEMFADAELAAACLAPGGGAALLARLDARLGEPGASRRGAA